MRRKVLLDECIDRNFSMLIDEHEVTTVKSEGWSSLKNGELLKVAQSKFDIFLTLDQNLIYQQNLNKFKITVVILKTRSSNIDELKRFIPKLTEVLSSQSLNSPTIVEI